MGIMYENYLKWKNTPVGGRPEISIIIPAYNETERLIPTIGAIASELSDQGLEWEMIVADDGSTDDTADIAESLGLVNLRVLRAPQNGGKGSAVRRGMAAARGRYILFTDADNSTPIEEIANLLVKVRDEGYDVAIGSRALSGGEEANKSAVRQLMSNGLRWMVQNIFSIQVQDSQCGFKLYTRDAADRLVLSQTIMGFSFDLEHLYLAQKYNMKIAEVPVKWVDAPGSKVDTRKEVQRFVRDLCKIKVNDWRGHYELSV
jgi:dolichyl-phosphate beta-glucosyltransferase